MGKSDPEHVNILNMKDMILSTNVNIKRIVHI